MSNFWGAVHSEAWGLAPISIWALKGATKYKRHDIVKSLDAEAIGPLRGPIRFLLAFPRPHEVSDLCALGLSIVKAAGLVQASWPAKLSRTIIIKISRSDFLGLISIQNFAY